MVYVYMYVYIYIYIYMLVEAEKTSSPRRSTLLHPLREWVAHH